MAHVAEDAVASVPEDGVPGSWQHGLLLRRQHPLVKLSHRRRERSLMAAWLPLLTVPPALLLPS